MGILAMFCGMGILPMGVQPSTGGAPVPRMHPRRFVGAWHVIRTDFVKEHGFIRAESSRTSLRL